VVEVVVSEEHELEVLDREAVARELLLERRQGLVASRPGVHERQGLASQQPEVDRAEERDGEGESGGLEPAALGG
jgi:hypothetical protein